MDAEGARPAPFKSDPRREGVRPTPSFLSGAPQNWGLPPGRDPWDLGKAASKLGPFLRVWAFVLQSVTLTVAQGAELGNSPPTTTTVLTFSASGRVNYSGAKVCLGAGAGQTRAEGSSVATR